MQRPRAKPRKKAPASAAAGRGGALIALDTHRIRQEALVDYRKAERELARASEQVKRYHERDLPGFRAWCQRTFGKLFTQLRDLQTSLNAKQAVAREISDVAARYDLGEVEAYREYLWRKANPEAAEEKDRRHEEERRRREEEARKLRAEDGEEDGGDLFAEELEEEDWGELEDMFAAFMGAPRARKGKAKADGTDTRSARELYRMIVRSLHPDHHGHMSESRKHLWDEAQAAWRDRDVEALQAILAQCEGGEVGIGPRSAVSTILQATRHLKDVLRRTRGQVRQLAKKLEWNYETRKSNPAYARKVESLILDDIRMVRFQLDRLTRALDTLEHKANRKKHPSRTRRHADPVR